MLETLFTTDLPNWRGYLSGIHGPSNLSTIIFVLSVASSFLLVRASNGLKILTIPISYFVLSTSARLFNNYLSDLQLDGLAGDQRIAVLTMVSHIAVGPILLYIFHSRVES